MQTLLKVNINWTTFIIFSLVIFILFPELSYLSYFALLISLHQFYLLFYSVNYVIPIRYLFGAFVCLQFFIGPVLAYNGLDEYQYFRYQMVVPENVYFGYALPAIIFFILGLHINAGKLNGEIIDEKKIAKFLEQNGQLPFLLIGTGFIASLISEFFSSEFSFVFYLLGSLKYIGVFLLILGDKKLKTGLLLIIYGSIILSSLGDGMFHDLLTWLIMLGVIMAIKYRPSIILKIITVLAFILLVVIIQQLKGSYRSAIGSGKSSDINTFQKVYEDEQAGNNIFNLKNLAGNNVRINQGFIITNIMRTVPAKVPYSGGLELFQILEAAFFPRILAPDKLKAGDRTLFTKYSGINIREGTSMGLSSLGDGYINFGVIGGCLFMFFLGFMYSGVLNLFFRHSKAFPILLLFTTLVFYYPIRPDCELQTALGHLVKSCFLIFVIFLVWKKYFIVYPQPPEKDIHTDTLVPASL